MGQNLTLEVVTPEKVLLETEADYVTVPGSIGELGILPGHIPLLTSLKSGVLSYRLAGTAKKLAVHHGYAEVCKDRITVLATCVELREDIDVQRAVAGRQKAEQELAEATKGSAGMEEIERLQKTVQKATARQEAAE